MDIRELKYFAQIASSASYSIASEKLYVSQPALSKVIQKLENELGVELFYTHQRQQRLTAEGQRLYEKALRVIGEYDDLIRSAQTQESIHAGQVYVGFPAVAGTCFFCELIAEFSKLYPDIRLHIEEHGTQRILSAVESGTLDVGCVVLPIPEDAFDSRLFVQDISCLVVSSSHPLAQRDRITLSELRDEAFVLLGTEFATHYDIRAALQEAGFEPNIVMLSSQWDFIIQLVRLNYGISFLPRSLFQRFYYPDIHLLEVDHLMQHEDLVLITKKGRYLSHNVQCFLNFVTEQMAGRADELHQPISGQ